VGILSVVYPITDCELSGLSHFDQVCSFIDAGCRLVQIRGKKESSDSLFEAVAKSLKAAEGTGTKVVVNDRVDIAIAAGAHGVHLGQDDLPPKQARKLLGEKAIIGYSTHSVDQARVAANLPVDYIAIGPIFGTRTKENPDPVVGLTGLEHVRKAISGFPLVAIGGINISNIAEVIAAGADSAAIIGDLYAPSHDLATRYQELESKASVKHN